MSYADNKKMIEDGDKNWKALNPELKREIQKQYTRLINSCKNLPEDNIAYGKIKFARESLEEQFGLHNLITPLPPLENPKVVRRGQAGVKISTLISNSYGGEVTLEESNDRRFPKWSIFYYGDGGEDGRFVVEELYYCQDRVLCFHTEEQAKRFMSNPENMILLYQYYMIAED